MKVYPVSREQPPAEMDEAENKPPDPALPEHPYEGKLLSEAVRLLADDVLKEQTANGSNRLEHKKRFALQYRANLPARFSAIFQESNND